jgi:hypothetical protein
LGTGTWIGGRLILTARHTVTSADGRPHTGVKVRFVGGSLCAATVVWPGSGAMDAALLSVDVPGGGAPDGWRPPEGLAPVRWGRLTGQGTGVGAQAVGFPDSVTPLAHDPREIEQVDGTINPLAGSRGGRYLMAAGVSPRHGGATDLRALRCGAASPGRR